ncbi:MAG: TorF family putative porin [Enhydrobacter sp.]|nr:TorF family putative porin [Enhydrobacter sp.]
MLKKVAATCIGLLTFCAAAAATAQTAPPAQTVPPATPAPPAAPAEEEKPVWRAPFGGTFSVGGTFATDYSYRGISQTQRQVAFQPFITYETPSVTSDLATVSGYVGAWASNVYFPPTNAFAEVDIIAGVRAKAMDSKLTFDLGYIRYNYPGVDDTLGFGFNEIGLVVGYDFGPVALSGAVRYSPNFFANSGNAWYKWAQATVPLPFININENVSFKLFGTIGNQSVQYYTRYGIPADNYWDWQLGATATVWGVDLTVAYTDTNIDVAGCLNTQNCQGRVIFSISKTF